MKRARLNFTVTLVYDPDTTNPEELCALIEQGLSVVRAPVEVESVRGGAEVAYFEAHQAPVSSGKLSDAEKRIVRHARKGPQ